jgi:gliding motility-associated-like protein
LVRSVTDQDGTVRDEQWNLTIDQCQETRQPIIASICQGNSYTWNNTTYTATTEKTNVYEETRQGRKWEITESLKLTVNPNPSFQVEVKGRTATIITQNTFDFITLDNQSPLTDTEYTWLSIGDHSITMTDDKGCSSTQAFSIIAEPIAPEVFFTPNDDGNNDTWDIENLEYYPDAIVQIYDRYSRLLTSIRGIDFTGWDGYYNNHIMPMDDYWYVILIPDNNEKVSGHFILKR